MSSLNKLSLKQFVKTEQSLRHQQIDNGLSLSQHTQQKSLKNEKRQSLKQGKKLKLNTLPCESTENQKDNGETFLFRSTWQDDMEHFKQQIKGCTSPTFATEILSNGHNHSSLFHANEQTNDLGQETSKRTRMSNSRSKSRHNKSLQKFIGDNVSHHRPSNSMVEKVSRQLKPQTSLTSNNNDQQKLLYDINKLQSQTYELKRQNKKTEQKYIQLKQKYQQLQEQLETKYHNDTKSIQCLMSNEQLLQKMRNQSFWKFYLKAQKMIRSSIAEGNHQSGISPINFMKELQALRELTSSMKKENKSLKKVSSEREEEVETSKDKLSIQEAQIEEMRLKCVAYESSIKRLRQEITKSQKQLQKLSQLKELQLKLSQKSTECSSLSRQLTSATQQLQQQKLLNSECQKQRLSAKKKCQQLNDQVLSLSKQLSSVKTSYNLLQMEKQQLSVNKKELIQKEKLKERVYQLEKEVSSLTISKEQQVAKMKNEYESRFGKEIEVKDSRVKELDQKVEKILNNLEELQSQNTHLSEENRKLSQQINKVREYNSRLEEELQQNQGQLSTAREQKENKLLQLSQQLQTLTAKLNEQSSSLLNQQSLIQQLKRQVHEKEELLKVKDYESQQLKASLIMIQEQQSSRVENQEERKDKESNNQAIEDNRAELEEYITKLQEKHNQALELYETVHNEKVQLQLQIQYYENYVQKLQANSNNQPNHPQSPAGKQETLQLIESLLTIKQEIIKKTLVFCPPDYKQLLVEYIYYGDMIKEKYLEIINSNHEKQQNQDKEQDYQNNQSDQDSYLQQEDYQQNISRQNRTTRNHQSTQPTSKYNKTKNYQNMYQTYDADHSSNSIDYSQDDTNDSKQEQINQLLQQFIKIGKIIDEETNPNSRKRNTQNQSKKANSKQKYDNYRNTKETQMHQFKNSINKKINGMKDGGKDIRPFSQQQQKYPSKPVNNNNRQPLQEISQKAQYSISRPLFTSNNIKSNIPLIKNVTQEQAYPNRPCFYQQPKQTLRSMNTPNSQVPYQKEVPPKMRNNFNHGVGNKLNMLKMAERLNQ